jgi:hypothetical protein
MCGLVGVVNKKTNGFTGFQQDVFTHLLYIDALRGMDSTGVFAVTNEGELHMAKDVGPSLKYMGTKEYGDLKTLAFREGSAMIGHNRKATKGSINPVNAHPFIVDDKICLVHNGTLYSHKQHADVEVDSHAIAHLLAKSDDVEEVMNKLDGAYALIWFNFEKGTLNFLRNNDRPLFWAECADEWLWCSEKEMIEFAAARSNLKIKDGPYELPEDTLLTYTLKDGTWGLENTKLKRVAKKTHSYTPSASDYSDACGYNSGDEVGWQFGQWHKDRHQNHRHTSPAYGLHAEDQTRAKLLVDNTNPATSITQKEYELGVKNCTLTSGSELGALYSQYGYGEEITAEAFDYSPVNEKDGSAGYFLWLCPIADPTLILRHRYEPNSVAETELVDYIAHRPFFKVKIKQRAWFKVKNVTRAGESVGWVLVNVTDIAPVAKVSMEQMNVH